MIELADDLYINIHELFAATPRSGLPVIVLSSSYWADASCVLSTEQIFALRVNHH